VYKLDVRGTSRFTDYIYGSTSTNKIYVADDLALSVTKKLYFDTGSNTYIHEPTGDQLAVVTGGTEAVRIASDGKVGIGTTAPGRQLTILDATQAEINLLSGADTSGGLIYQNANEQKLLIANRESDGCISFQTGGTTERLVIGSSGISTFSGIVKVVDTELQETSDNFSINIQSGNNDFYVKSGGTTFAAFKGSAKDLQLTSGNLVIGTAGKGIDFSAQTATSATGATSNSEILDHYEEGTWTPTFEGSTSGSGTLTNYGAWYTRIGRVVHFYCYIVCTGLGTISGNIKVAGLPFTVHATGGYQAVNFSAVEGLAITAGESLAGYCEINDDAFTLQLWDATTGTSNLTSAELSADGGFIASGTYFA
jgi:hypothetical protein